jgi:hypothetical protein
MSSRHVFASIPIACLLAVGLLGTAPQVANAESVGALKTGKIAKSNAAETKKRFRRLSHFHSVKIPLAIGPTSIYQDYPYYYSRGHYPTHIGGYAYYPYYYGRGFYPTYVGTGPARRQEEASH